MTDDTQLLDSFFSQARHEARSRVPESDPRFTHSVVSALPHAGRLPLLTVVLYVLVGIACVALLFSEGYEIFLRITSLNFGDVLVDSILFMRRLVASLPPLSITNLVYAAAILVVVMTLTVQQLAHKLQF